LKHFCQEFVTCRTVFKILLENQLTTRFENFTANKEKILLDLATNRLKWQLYYLASGTSFSETITLSRKTAVLLKLTKANFSGFFISTVKI